MELFTVWQILIDKLIFSVLFIDVKLHYIVLVFGLSSQEKNVLVIMNDSFV